MGNPPTPVTLTISPASQANKVKLVPTTEVRVSPIASPSSPWSLSVAGVRRDPDLGVDPIVAKLDGLTIPVTPEAWVKRPRKYRILIHPVQADGDILPPQDVPTAASLQTELNRIWGKQANVFFEVIRGPNQVVPYDLSPDGVAPADKALADPRINDAEFVILANALPTPPGFHFSIYFVRRIQEASVGGTVLRAFTSQRRNGPALGFKAVVGDVHAGTSQVLTAHEVGHLLGIEDYESSNSDDVMYGLIGGASNNPCEVRKHDWNIVNP